MVSARQGKSVLVLTGVLALLALLPACASAQTDLLGNVLQNVLGGQSGASQSPSAGSSPRAGVPPAYVPPLHGTNPHGQGDVATADLGPFPPNPLSGDPTQGENVVLGSARGEQDGSGNYHGTITPASLLGIAVAQVTTNAGETKEGPLDPFQTGVLDPLCASSGGNVCLNVLTEHSATATNSSSNHFELLGIKLGGAGGLNADVANSHGNITGDSSCQTAHGDSGVADVSIGGMNAVSVFQGTSDSTACNNGTQSATASSSDLTLGGTGVPIPVAGCANGTPNSNFTVLAPLLSIVCNADDTNGSQTGAPYNVRESLALFLLNAIKLSAAGPEAHVVAPPAPAANTPTPPTVTNPTAGNEGGNQGGRKGNGNGNGGNNGSAANSTVSGNGSLPFTGADLLVLALIGGALVLGGISLSTGDRRHREAA